VAEALGDHIARVCRAMCHGTVVPFLGAGVNRAGRSDDIPWTPEQSSYAPDGRELADHLARSFKYPEGEPTELVRVSQYVSVVEGTGELYWGLHRVFDADFPPSAVHRLLARLPGLRAKKGYTPENGYSPGFQLIVTTNYDDVLERAFRDENEPFGVLTYVAKGPLRGRFISRPPNGAARAIKKSNQDRLGLDDHSLILKIHGAIDRANPDADSYVISEDDYIDYLTETSVANALPVKLNRQMHNAHFLFLGYGMRDWNLRVILRRIWGEQKLDWPSWSVQRSPDDLDAQFWAKRNVEIYDVDLRDYVSRLEACLRALPHAGAGA
jgi:SIR2-like domain